MKQENVRFAKFKRNGFKATILNVTRNSTHVDLRLALYEHLNFRHAGTEVLLAGLPR